MLPLYKTGRITFATLLSSLSFLSTPPTMAQEGSPGAEFSYLDSLDKLHVEGVFLMENSELRGISLSIGSGNRVDGSRFGVISKDNNSVFGTSVVATQGNGETFSKKEGCAGNSVGCSIIVGTSQVGMTIGD